MRGSYCPMGRGQGCCSLPYNTQHRSPEQRIIWPQGTELRNCSNAKFYVIFQESSSFLHWNYLRNFKSSIAWVPPPEILNSLAQSADQGSKAPGMTPMWRCQETPGSSWCSQWRLLESRLLTALYGVNQPWVRNICKFTSVLNMCQLFCHSLDNAIEQTICHTWHPYQLEVI